MKIYFAYFALFGIVSTRYMHTVTSMPAKFNDDIN